LRNPDEAVVLAERAVSLSGRRDISVLDALAAAYAAAGRFEEAVATATAGVDAAAAAGATDVAARFRERLDLYRQHQAYRMPRSNFP
jgi:hypothetical protein